MSKPKFITICQQAKQLLNMIPDKEETIQYLIDNYREAAEFFFLQKECIGNYTALTRNIPMWHPLLMHWRKLLKYTTHCLRTCIKSWKWIPLGQQPSFIADAKLNAPYSIIKMWLRQWKAIKAILWWICFQVLLNQKRQTFLHLLAMSCHSEINDSDSWWSEGKLLTWQHE